MSPKKILVIRFSSIGDIVLTSPVLRAVKSQFPAVEIHYLTKPAFVDLVKHNPHVDRVFALNKNIAQTIKELKKQNYDRIIDLHRSLRSRRIVSNGVGPVMQPWHKLNVKKFIFSKLKVDLLPDVHLVDRYFDALKKINVQDDGLGLEHYYDRSGLSLGDFNISSPYVVFAIGGTYTTKRLPNEKIVEICSKLTEPVVLIGGDADTENGQEIAENTKALNLCGQLTFDQSAFLIENASHVICHDSGMMHIASAFDRPLSVIWGNTHPKFGMYPFRVTEYYSHQLDLKCRPCSKLGYDECPKKHFKCMNLQNVDEIVQKIEI